LLENNCFSCHNPQPDAQPMIAPSWPEIKAAYTQEGNADFASFSRQLTSFLHQPDSTNVLLPEAVVRYGPMPVVQYSDAQIQAIATYLFQSKLEAPDWFTKVYPMDKAVYLTGTDDLEPLELGQYIAMKTKGVLGKNLLGAIQSRGTEYAVSFCSERAYPLTDSMAGALKATVRRVSDRNRNPLNAADAVQLDYLQRTRARLAAGEPTPPEVRETEGGHVGFYPIVTNQMCLQCHGKVGADISEATQARLSELYPEDKAVGYEENELRGIWVVEMAARSN